MRGRRRRFATAVLWLAIATLAFSWPVAAAATQGVPGLSSFVVGVARTADPPPMDASMDHAVWRGAAHVSLTWNVDFRRPADDPTDAYLLTDGKYLYAAFVARQKSTPLVTQHTIGAAVNDDDWVAVFFWPSGVNGFSYMFKCNAIGICDQTSSENTDFAPLWKAAGKITADGFIVTMRIPLDALRGDRRDQWRVQFARQVNRTGDDTPVWAHAPGMEGESQPEFSGYLNGMHDLGASLRSRPRLAVYGLGAVASAAVGGNTSRIGADIAIPVTQTASIIGTAHPDYSNVELDQQTIAPTEFKRRIQEFRPFFTQGANFYNQFSSIDDTGNIMLYTPGLPTPSTGLAFEGTQGDYGLAAFDASSPARIDAAQSASWSSADKVYSAALQRVTVNMPGFADRATAGTFRIDNQRNAYAYADFGTDAGTNVLDPTQAGWAEIGAAHHGTTSFLGAALRKIGAYYNPFDGFVAHTDIAGWAANGEQDVLPRTGPILSVELLSSIDRYHDAEGNLDQADQNVELSMQTRSQYSVSVSSGSNFLLSNGEIGGLFDQNGVNVGYREGSTTPTTLTYNVGRFGAGYMRSWERLVSFQTGPRGSVSLEADDIALALDDGNTDKQWLERAAFAYQLGPQASLAVGVRRIVGVEPPVFSMPSFVDASNVSIALHDRVGRDDVYLVYGDANALATPPQLILKWVHYFGAEKGT